MGHVSKNNMAIFKTKKETKDLKRETQSVEPAAKKASESKASTLRAPSSTSHVLRRPRITEKAANMTSQNVYTFDIDMRATKREVMDAVKTFYKVTPVKVNVVNTPAKRVKLKKKRGFGKTAGGFVYPNRKCRRARKLSASPETGSWETFAKRAGTKLSVPCKG